MEAISIITVVVIVIVIVIAITFATFSTFIAFVKVVTIIAFTSSSPIIVIKSAIVKAYFISTIIKGVVVIHSF